MFVPFDTISDSSRVWVYQAERKLSSDEVSTISTKLNSFTHQWMAHNQPLKASFSIKHNRFIILAVDESFNQASGCSIDSSVHVVKELETSLRMNLFDRTQVAFFIDDDVRMLSVNSLSRKFEEGVWSAETIVFDNTIQLKRDIETKWKIPAGSTWLKRYLAKSAV